MARPGDTQKLASRLRNFDPTLRVSNLRERLPVSRQFDLASYANWRRSNCPLRPLWVKRVGFVMSAVCPVYPKKQTFPGPVGISHLCQ